ncbi:MAG: VIT1/CCC1 transporter family protein [Nanoarchaeota archaeon]|nr:VIT1/CCC1 transporter family protein [Nanoarchaeota archaeon]
MKHIHDHHGVEEHTSTGQHIKSIIYGGLDGIITTFAVVSGVAGAHLEAGVILIMGFANLIADGISMAVGDYLSTKAEQEYQKRERQREEWELHHYPKGEKEEMIEIYIRKGYSKEDATKIISLLMKNKDRFVDTMMADELGIPESAENPVTNAAFTFGSFILFGFVPLFAFVGSKLFGWFGEFTFPLSMILTALTMFSLGAAKVRLTGRDWLKSGLEMLFVGGLAASAAYGIGVLLGGLA